MMQSCIQRNYKSEFLYFLRLCVIELCRPNLPMLVYEADISVKSVCQNSRC